jgi:hypothetical protein
VYVKGQAPSVAARSGVPGANSGGVS